VFSVPVWFTSYLPLVLPVLPLVVFRRCPVHCPPCSVAALCCVSCFLPNPRCCFLLLPFFLSSQSVHGCRRLPAPSFPLWSPQDGFLRYNVLLHRDRQLFRIDGWKPPWNRSCFAVFPFLKPVSVSVIFTTLGFVFLGGVVVNILVTLSRKLMT